ncbi:TonB-dependent receptor [Coprobacter sp. LH1063]|uniref:TonB-dependent receptor n=2 Tax=Coprobacter tertius TaxID=2944915 RepID=A0ABT1MJI4_9BACT|nr:TonB-dependent receptor [Coprobacter tertius]
MKKKLRLFTLLLFSWCTMVQAQNVTLNLNNVTVKDALEAVKKQTGNSFFFNVNDVDMTKRITINVKDESLKKVLGLILEGQPLNYEIKDNHIVLSKLQEQTQEEKELLINGRVTDAAGELLIGVNIAIDGIGKSITDMDGNYSIKVPKGSTLTFTYIGYKPFSVKVKEKTTINVRMEENSNALDEVVVIGYGTQKKVNLTGAIGYIDSKAIENRPVATLGQAIQGTIPNLNITFGSGKPGEATNMNIRGFASINEESKPLILIDGIEGNIDNLNPRDVESISVLKDASSAIYGARAPFGVVLVTTKKGKSGKMQINYNGRFSFSTETTNTDFITTGYDAARLADGFMTSYNGNPYTRYTEDDYKELEARRFDKTENPARPWTVIQNRTGEDTYMYYANFDWYNYLIDSSRPTWDNNISISGGTDKVNYMVSGNFNTQTGIYAQNADKYKTGNLRARLNAEVKSWLTLNFSTSFFSSKYSAPGLGHGNNLPNYTFHALPFLMPYNPDGTHVFSNPVISQQPTDGVHIMTADGNSKSVDDKKQMIYSVGATFNLFKGLSFITNYSFKLNTVDYMERTAKSQFSQHPGILEDAGGSLFKNKLRQLNERTYYHSIDAYFNYGRSFGGHNLNAVLGFNYEQSAYKKNYATKLNIQSNNLNDFNLGDIGKDVTLEGGQNEWALLGYFGRLGYDWQGKYLADVIVRWDASSRFPRDQRAGIFPSLTAGWRISEEKFFEPARNVVSNLKIRGSIGALGNQAVKDCYLYLQTINMVQFDNYLIDGEKLTYAQVSPPPTAGNLTWETIIHKNLGIDVGLFNNRLTYSADLFIRDTKDMLVPGKVLPGVYGAKSPRENAADLRTKGFEMTLGWNDSFTLFDKPFSYNLSLSLADSRSFITKYDNPLKEFSKSSYYVGMEIGEIWGYHVSGLFETDEQAKAYQEAVDHSYVCKNILETAIGENKGLKAGDMIFEDLDGSGRIDDGKKTADDRGDMRIIGNSRPRYTYSGNVGFSWAGIDCSAFFQGIGRQNRYPGGNAMLFWGGYARPYASFTPIDLPGKIWTEDNPDAYFPRMRGYAAQGDRSLAKVNDRYLQNLAYCRLKNVTIGYTLPHLWTAKVGIDRVRFYFSGDNLLTWTKLKTDYVDPEQFSADADARVYPYAKTFSFGLDLTF